MIQNSTPANFSRRTLLQGAAGAAIAGTSLGTWLNTAHAAEPTVAAAAPSSEKRFKRAVKIGMVRPGKTLLEKCQLMKKLGYDGLELDVPGPYAPEEVLKAKAETGLEIPGAVDSIHWQQRLSDPSPEVRAKGLEALLRGIKEVKAFGGTSVLLVPGRVTKDATYEECWKRSIAEIKKATPAAEAAGIHILIENVWNDFLTDPKELARYIDECESKMVGSYFDIGNTVRYSPPHEWVPILGKRIVKLDFKDYQKDKEGQKGKGFGAKLLEGDVDWPKVVAELKKIGFSGWATAEVSGGDEAWLADVGARMDKIFAL